MEVIRGVIAGMELTVCTLDRNDGTDKLYMNWKEKQFKSLGIKWLKHEGPITDFSEARNSMDRRAKTDFVLHIDSDEYITTSDLTKILSSKLDNRTRYCFNRYNYFGSYERIRIDSGCYPDTQYRLYDKGHFGWKGKVHEFLKGYFCMQHELYSGFIIHHFSWLKPIPYQEDKHEVFHKLAGKKSYWRFPNLHHVLLRKVENIQKTIEKEMGCNKI